jgi:hypothetical protein
LNIIVKSKKTEGERRNSESAQAQKKHYYGREIRDGNRFQSKAGSKEQIKKALDDASG